jgi:hypothetical protein
MLVAAVVFAASLLLALTLPDREPRIDPCPIGTIDPTGRCGISVDHRTPERVAIVLAGLLVAGGLIVAGRRMAPPPPPGEPPDGPSPPGDPV